MAYTIKKSDGSTLVSLAENTISTDACTLALVGRRSVNYGQNIAENFVKLLENSCANSAPANPLMGQFWFSKTAKQLKIFDGSGWFTLLTISVSGLNLTGYQLVSTAVAPTAPIIVASRVKVVDLNADLLDGYESSVSVVANTIPVRSGAGDIFATKFQGVATSALYADLAERFEASEPLEAGDVITIGGDKEICKASMGKVIIGVISTDPAFRMNEGAGDDSTHPFVGYIGRVPTKVFGSCRKGDRLYISHIEGVAITASAGGMVGIALEDSDEAGVHLVNTLIGVK